MLRTLSELILNTGWINCDSVTELILIDCLNYS